MTTSAQRSTGGWEQPDLGLTWSAEASPASRSAPPAGSRAQRTNGGAGPGTGTSFAWYDPASSSWRTSQLSLPIDTPSASSSPTWPRAGMTRNGTAYRLRPSAPRTSVTGSSLWPTPVAHDDGKTPEAHLAMKQRMPGGPRSTITSLTVMVKAVERGLWPTPRATDGDRGGRGDLLAMVRTGLDSRRKNWPTPTATRRSGLQSHGANAVTGQLNPTWVEWLMGFPPGWTDLGPSATPSSPRSPSTSADS